MCVSGGGEGFVFAVREDGREYTSSQLLASICALAEGMNRMRAPNQELWTAYCEPLYTRMARRLQHQVEGGGEIRVKM